MKIVVGVTGASGIPYAVKLIEQLSGRCELHLVVSEPAKEMIEMETSSSFSYLEEKADFVYDNKDMGCSICSGSFLFDSMIIVPCSMSTLAKVSSGISDNVISRAASVALKEKRKLVVVPRETPLNTIQIENMLRLSNAGGIVLPAMPGFYSEPKNIEDVINFIVARIMDSLEIENELSPRWE